MFLSLPIPQPEDKILDVVLLPRFSRSYRHAFRISRNASVAKVKQHICSTMGWPAARMYEVFQHKIYKTYLDSEEGSWPSRDVVYVAESVRETGYTDLPIYITSGLANTASSTGSGSGFRSSYSSGIISQLTASPLWLRIFERISLDSTLDLDRISGFSKAAYHNVILTLVPFAKVGLFRKRIPGDGSTYQYTICDAGTSPDLADGWEPIPDLCSIAVINKSPTESARFSFHERNFYEDGFSKETPFFIYPLKQAPTESVVDTDNRSQEAPVADDAADVEMTEASGVIDPSKISSAGVSLPADSKIAQDIDFSKDCLFVLDFTQQMLESLFGETLSRSYSGHSESSTFSPERRSEYVKFLEEEQDKLRNEKSDTVWAA